MIAEPQKKMRPLWRWVIGIAGTLSICLLWLAYTVNRAIRIKYFHDYSWPGLIAIDSLWLVASIYLILVGVLGRWKA